MIEIEDHRTGKPPQTLSLRMIPNGTIFSGDIEDQDGGLWMMTLLGAVSVNFIIAVPKDHLDWQQLKVKNYQRHEAKITIT